MLHIIECQQMLIKEKLLLKTIKHVQIICAE